MKTEILVWGLVFSIFPMRLFLLNWRKFQIFTVYFLASLLVLSPVRAESVKVEPVRIKRPALNAKAALVLDAKSGEVLFSKNPHMRLPAASTTKVMTALVALERLGLKDSITISAKAHGMPPSKAGLRLGRAYYARDLIIATLVSSSNDAAVALAEAVSGSEAAFCVLMNQKARDLGMFNTCFVNATGLPSKKKNQKQYSTADDLSRLIWYAARDKKVDAMMSIVKTQITGSDGRAIPLKAHNKMLWKTPGLIKGKTGWTVASRQTFVGTDYSAPKTISFAMLSSQKPWMDVERLARFGMLEAARHSFV